MKLEQRVEILEKRVDQTEKNIRYVNAKTDIIKSGLNDVESTFMDLKTKLDKIDSSTSQDHSYDIDLSKGSLSVKNPRLEYALIMGVLGFIGFLVHFLSKIS